jgi:hypothetical protein
MISKILDFIAVAGVIYFVGPIAFDHDHPIFQAAAITLLAFVGKTLLSPEGPEIYLVNGKDGEENE